MSHPINDRINDYLSDEYHEAMAIILKSISSGKELISFKLWEHLEPGARIQALKDSFSKCDRCYQTFHVSKLQEAESNMYGTFWECPKCISKREYI